MTESVWFEADEERYRELTLLAEELAASEQELLDEAPDLLLSAYRGRGHTATVGLLADLHDVQRRFRVMVRELEFISFTTATMPSADLDLPHAAFDILRRHYASLFQSSERALKAAGIGPFFKEVEA